MVTRALARGLDVLEALSKADDRGLGVTAVAAAVTLDKATVVRLLQTLVAQGYVVRDPISRCYRLTAKILRLAHGLAAQLDLLSLARPHLRTLRDDVGETVHLGVMDGFRVVYMDKLESTNSFRLVSAVGQSMPLYSTALGKAILAALPEAESEGLAWQMEFVPRTERTIGTPAALVEELRKTRARGYAVDDEENEPMGTCVAAAIMGLDRRPLGAVSVSGPVFRVRDHLSVLGMKVRDTATVIGVELGGISGSPVGKSSAVEAGASPVSLDG
jgi:DNA-binding IclR family transcriptional regulator